MNVHVQKLQQRHEKRRIVNTSSTTKNGRRPEIHKGGSTSGDGYGGYQNTEEGSSGFLVEDADSCADGDYNYFSNGPKPNYD